MLFDFHQRQNRKKPKTVHAIYLLKGRDKNPSPTKTNGAHDEDTVMQSSPPFSSSAVLGPTAEDSDDKEEIDTFRITLAKEDDLGKAKALFDELQSVHIYSLSPAAPQDLQVLTECSRRIAVASVNEDPLKDWAQYGVIQNEHVKRRSMKRPPPAAAAPKPAAAAPAKPTTSPKDPALATLRRSESSEQSRPASRNSTTSKTTSKQPAMKRESSNLMKAFANAPPKKSKPEQKQKEDETMALSDEEAGADDMDLDEGAITSQPSEKDKTSKKDREAALQAMMDAEGTSAECT